jgi:predicted ABC-type ATPase
MRPVFTPVAGANGAGKSSLTGGNPRILGLVPVLDPDALNPIQSDAALAIAAGREVLQRAARHLLERSSFAVETTLSGMPYLRMMQDARARGFEVDLIYIGTESVEINLERIRGRVALGGHDVPEEDVRRRYVRSLERLTPALDRADHAVLFDNSTDEGYRVVGLWQSPEMTWFGPRPEWTKALEPTAAPSE